MFWHDLLAELVFRILLYFIANVYPDTLLKICYVLVKDMQSNDIIRGGPDLVPPPSDSLYIPTDNSSEKLVANQHP